jgi:hypothetical protein
MIHWLADEDEVAWVDEGMAELAMWLFGHPDAISGFNSQPDNDLTSWNGLWADYIKTYLWSLYFYEQMGGQPAVWRVLHEPANSSTGYENVLDQLGSPLNFNDVFANWACANFLDDPTLDRGQYGYRGDDLPAFTATTKSAYPVAPTNGSVLRYAADYVKFINGVPQLLGFDGTDIGVWSIRALFLEGGAAQHVAPMTLDAVDAGTLPIYGFGTDYDTVVLMVAKFSPTSTTGYQYRTENPNAAGVDPMAEASGLAVRASPNPVLDRGLVSVTLPRSGDLRVDVLDPAGRLVRTLAGGTYPAGDVALAWDGRTESGAAAPAGMYLIRAETAGGGQAVRRWTLLR